MRAALVFAGFAVLGFGLSGCIAYDVAATTVGAATTVAGTAVDVTGDVVSAPFDAAAAHPAKKK